MIRHPEQQDGEIFVGNTDGRLFNVCQWHTKRAGGLAFNGDGGLLPNMFPLFVKRSEIETVAAMPGLEGFDRTRLVKMLDPQWSPYV